MPAAVVCGDPIPVKLVAANAGTGTLRGVTVVDILPTGLLTADGKSQVTFEVGNLAAGQSKTMVMDARATRAGTFTNEAVATAGAWKAKASVTVSVAQPVGGMARQ